MPKTIVYGCGPEAGMECLPQTVAISTERQGFSAGLPTIMRARNGSEEPGGLHAWRHWQTLLTNAGRLGYATAGVGAPARRLGVATSTSPRSGVTKVSMGVSVMPISTV